MLAPEKWTEKIRSMAAIPHPNYRTQQAEERARGGVSTRLEDSSGGGAGGDNEHRKGGGNWLSQVKSRAESAIKVSLLLL